VDDCFAVEATSAILHDCANGDVHAMTGTFVAHNHIAANVLTG
jgi:hypothetical protein